MSSLHQQLLAAQRSELTEYMLYAKLAPKTRHTQNRKILFHLSRDELRHYHFWKKYTKQDVSASMFKVYLYLFLAMLLGITFGTKLMERGEKVAQRTYTKLIKSYPKVRVILQDEHDHEKHLLSLIAERRVHYIGPIVLGLNDALVELTGALAGFTFALQYTSLIALAGMITGFAASLSMAASVYLSTRSEENSRNPFTAAFYTGIAYFVTVILLILPYLFVDNALVALMWTIGIAIFIIFCFTGYLSIAKDYSFKHRFAEMALLSLSVAALSFVVGYFLRMFIPI